MDQSKLSEEGIIKNINFNRKARYRCEQLNLSKVDGNLTGNGKQKFQYSVHLDSDKKFGRVKLEEHYYDFSPAVLNKSFEMISESEKIKNNNVVFSINENINFDKILNKVHLKRDWVGF